jgi:hypothetical protein
MTPALIAGAAPSARRSTTKSMKAPESIEVRGSRIALLSAEPSDKLRGRGFSTLLGAGTWFTLRSSVAWTAEATLRDTTTGTTSTPYGSRRSAIPATSAEGQG